jgi:DNA-binding protein H-NS
MPRKKKEPLDLSVDEIQAQLKQIEADKKALALALKKRREAELAGFAQGVRDQIIAAGYTADEICAVISRGKRRASSSRRPGVYPRYANPDNPSQVYSRGPLPAWLKELMEAQGYDANDKAQREEFKSSYLTQMA